MFPNEIWICIAQFVPYSGLLTIMFPNIYDYKSLNSCKLCGKKYIENFCKRCNYYDKLIYEINSVNSTIFEQVNKIVSDISYMENMKLVAMATKELRRIDRKIQIDKNFLHTKLATIQQYLNVLKMSITPYKRIYTNNILLLIHIIKYSNKIFSYILEKMQYDNDSKLLIVKKLNNDIKFTKRKIQELQDCLTYINI